MLTNMFTKEKVLHVINPDDSVAYGAAVYAAVLAGNKPKVLQDIVHIDAVSYSLGVETKAGLMTPLITCGTELPTKCTNLFSTAVDYQSEVFIKVYEGNATYTKDTRLIGVLHLQDIEHAPKGVPRIWITFDVALDGMLTVFGRDGRTDKSKYATGARMKNYCQEKPWTSHSQKDNVCIVRHCAEGK